jgi:4-hydroxy-tetrahydrodipicolinate reductase
VKLAIAGASGRMGRMLIEAAFADRGSPAFEICAALDRAGSPDLGRDAAEFLGRRSGAAVTADLDAVRGADVLIDFTRPEGTLEHLRVCQRHGVRMIIGTTGFDAAGKDAIRAAAQTIAIVFSPNMGIGVNVTFKLLETAARILAAGGGDYDVEVVETHHRHKVDAPSGTALAMGEVIAAAQGRTLDEIGVFGRHGQTGERKPGTIGFSAIRGGDVVGDHTVLFAGTGERIEITHRASSRMTYALGSLRAARFLAERRSGLFDMHDVLGLRGA